MCVDTDIGTLHFFGSDLALHIQDGTSKSRRSLLKLTRLLTSKDRAVEGWDHPYAPSCQPVTV